jgi:hypothetical protein
LAQQPSERIEPAAAVFGRDVRRVKPSGDCLFLHLADDLHRQVPAPFDQRLVRVQFGLDKGARRLGDHPLFIGQGKVHGPRSFSNGGRAR